MNSEELKRILTDKGLAQFGDSLLNFAYSISATRTTGKPKGFKVPDTVLAEAATKAGLRKLLPSRVNRGEVANSLEAILGYAWLEKILTLDEVVTFLSDQFNLIPSENFARVGKMVLARLTS